MPTDQPDFPPVVPGSRVTLQLMDRTYYLADLVSGQRVAAGYLPAPPWTTTVLAREDCRNEDGESHLTTVCADCISSWATDYYVVLAENQADDDDDEVDDKHNGCGCSLDSYYDDDEDEDED